MDYLLQRAYIFFHLLFLNFHVECYKDWINFRTKLRAKNCATKIIENKKWRADGYLKEIVYRYGYLKMYFKFLNAVLSFII